MSITVSNMSMSYGQKNLFENVSLQLSAPNRYGLTGANGAGKSTFLRILSGEEQPNSGLVQIVSGSKIGFLKQDQDLYHDWLVLSVVISGNENLWKALEQKKQLLQEETLSKEKATKLAQWEEVIHAQSGYAAESEASQILSGLGLSQKMIAGKMSELSGGFRLRVLLAKVLFARPNITLLDEPTNHLDIVSIAWLEKFLTEQWQGMLVLISHDRSFLNRVCNYIADVDFNTISLYKGNYETFLQASALAMEQRLKEIESQEKKVAETLAFIDRFKAKASKARQAQSRVKQLEKMEIPEVIKSSRRYPTIRFDIKRPSGKQVLKVSGLRKSFHKKKILHDIDFEIFRGQRVAIIGANGVGKSTLLKMLVDVLPVDEGTITKGYETYFSYFAQEYQDQLNQNQNQTVFDWLYERSEQLEIGKVHGILGNFLFSQDDSKKKLMHLSGGEAARLMLAKLTIDQANVLVLDEPTNHLDIESVEKLKDALINFAGTIIFVSHDRSFIEQVANAIFSISLYENNKQHFISFDGSYPEFLDKFGQDWFSIDSLKKIPNKNKTEEKSDGALAYVQRKENKSLLQKTNRLSKKTEEEIAVIEKRLKEIEDIFAHGKIFLEHPQQANSLDKERKNLHTKIEDLLQHWETLQNKIANIENVLKG